MSQPVFYHSGMAGFPAGNTRTAGGLLAVFDACLVNGANSVTAVTLTQTGGVATMTFAGNHNFSVGDRVLVEGATPAGYSGLKTVTAKAADSISYAVDSGLAGTATGTATVKHPGAGWSKLSLDTNVAAYRSSPADGGMGHWLQVEDNNPYNDSFASSRVRAAENLTALGVADAITDACRWTRNTSCNQWWVVADAKTFYWGIGQLSSPTSSQYYANSYMAGEFVPTVASDTYAWGVSCGYSDASSAGGFIAGYASKPSGLVPTAGDSTLLLRSFDGLRTGAPAANTVCGAPGNGATTATAQASMSTSDPRTGAFYVTPIWLVENTLAQGTDVIFRARFRGVYHPYAKPTLVYTAKAVGTKSPYPISLAGKNRELVVTATCGSTNLNTAESGTCHALVFDHTGPWE